jgi:hypothetical protein
LPPAPAGLAELLGDGDGELVMVGVIVGVGVMG